MSPRRRLYQRAAHAWGGVTGKLGGNLRGIEDAIKGLGCRLGRRWTVATGDQHPTTRTAGEPAGAPRCQILPHTNEKCQASQKRYLTFLCFLSKNDALGQKEGEKPRFYAAFP